MQLNAPNPVQDTRDLFQKLTEVLPHLVLVRRPDGFLEYCNQRWYTYTRTNLTSLSGENWLFSVHPDDRARVRDRWRTTIQTGQFHDAEFRLRDGLTGKYHWFLERVVPLTDPQGRVEH